MFTILGADGKEYGPAPAEKIREWIVQKRANAQTKVRTEGSAEWRSLGIFPEFADVLGPPGSPPTLAGPALSASRPSELPPDILQRDYTLDIGACFSHAWDLITGKSAWLIIGGVAIWILIQMGLGGLGGIPIVGPVFSIANMLLAGPLTGGLYWFLLRCLRGENAGIENLFDGFRYRFIHLFLANLVIMILSIIAAIPGACVIGISIFPMIMGGRAAAWALGPIVVGGLLMLIPLIYLGVSWIFTLPLVADKQLDFWPAMETSRKVVAKHWLQIFILALLAGILSLVGVLLCCVGWFFTAPLAMLALLAGYEMIFHPRPAAK